MNLDLPNARSLPLHRPVIVGILNVTPDSFSDGGAYGGSVDAAVHAGLAMHAGGAAVIDVGGESTRPGAQRVGAAEQIARVVPVIERLTEAAAGADKPGPVISIDTTSAAVASAALDAGASIINDVSAGREDEGLFPLAAERGAGLILMHMLGEPGTMQDAPRYDDVVGAVCGFLTERAAEAEAAGVAPEQIVLDPGIGFGKTLEHNLALLAGLDRVVALGYPVMLGTSRKRFIGGVMAAWDGSSPQTDQRLPGTLATTALGVAAGVKLFRMHDVPANAQAAATAWAIGQAAG